MLGGGTDTEIVDELLSVRDNASRETSPLSQI